MNIMLCLSDQCGLLDDGKLNWQMNHIDKQCRTHRLSRFTQRLASRRSRESGVLDPQMWLRFVDVHFDLKPMCGEAVDTGSIDRMLLTYAVGPLSFHRGDELCFAPFVDGAHFPMGCLGILSISQPELPRES